MAFFERGDERDALVLCKICNAKCSESSKIRHQAKCRLRPENRAKFEKGHLLVCDYNPSHIIPAGGMDDHLEFCGSYQSRLLEQYQLREREQLLIRQEAEPTRSPADDFRPGVVTWDQEEMCNNDERYKALTARMKAMNFDEE